jgi:hypothetical protein
VVIGDDACDADRVPGWVGVHDDHLSGSLTVIDMCTS